MPQAAGRGSRALRAAPRGRSVKWSAGGGMMSRSRPGCRVGSSGLLALGWCPVHRGRTL